MLPKTTERVSARLPKSFTLNYFADRQSPWLLAHKMPDDVRVAALRKGDAGKLVDRPTMRGLLARSGGVLARRDVEGLAFADDLSRIDATSPACAASLDHVWALPWLDFEVTFTTWGTSGYDWQHLQTTRPGLNLVVQLNFPPEHDALVEAHDLAYARAAFEVLQHPIKVTGRPTLAWARLDLDLGRGEALIEEVQSDWLRLAAAQAANRLSLWPTSSTTAAYVAYHRDISARYAKVWQPAVLLAALLVVRDILGLRRIWMHTPEVGATLKGIEETLPPRSLYTQLPKGFCFQLTDQMPGLVDGETERRRTRVQNKRLKRVRSMRRTGRSIFWRLDL